MTSVRDVALGWDNTCAILTDGSLYCWGNAADGKLGDGGTTASLLPKLANKFTSPVKKAALGTYHTCVILDDANKSVQCVGNGSSGRLGHGASTNSLDAVVATGLVGAVDIASRQGGTCALLSDKTMRCWGWGGQGQIGDGGGGDRNVPTVVTGLTNVKGISVGSNHVCAVKEDKTALCWGENNEGRLARSQIIGDVNQSLPQYVTGLSNASEIGVGHAHSCEVNDVGNVYCWGFNNRGQTGSSNADYRNFNPGSVISRYTQEY